MKNGVFLFVISHLVPELFKIFVLCKLGTDDVIRCENMEVKTFNNVLWFSQALTEDWKNVTKKLAARAVLSFLS